MSRPSFDPASETYVSLATFRLDGREVRTPVWIAALDDRYYVFSEGEVGKVKRIRATKRVRVAPCNFRGTLRGDAWLEGRGRVVKEPELIDRAYAALTSKYGWQMKLGNVFSRLIGHYHKRVILEIELGEPSGSS